MRRLPVLALLAVALAGGLASCGGGGDAGAPEAAVAEAATKTKDARTYRTSFQVTFADLTDDPVSLTGEGLFDAETRIGRMRFDMSAFSRAAGGPDLGKAEFVYDRAVVYMKFPFLEDIRPDAKPWIRFDLQEIGKDEGIDIAGLAQLDQTDPSKALEYLRATTGEVKEVGEEDVRGEATTHYRAIVDLDRLAERAPAQKATIDRIIELSGIKEVPTDILVDGEGRVRRMKLTYEDMRTATGQKSDMTLTMELFDFGVEVDVRRPPPNQVSDLRDLQEAAKS